TRLRRRDRARGLPAGLGRHLRGHHDGDPGGRLRADPPPAPAGRGGRAGRAVGRLTPAGSAPYAVPRSGAQAATLIPPQPSQVTGTSPSPLAAGSRIAP